ncbi:sodium channel protein 1 brain-like isoform X2 [Montipora foliosa]|uniref:sodium channel protein 1 brain-like isoform X1 n=2 Tax=Montipora foliosa TaxID=591990 RepID=UPI0035F1B51B
MIASAAARAHHGREEKLSREEAYRRSQLVLGDGDSVALPAEEELYTPLAPHYLLVPFKDCDYGVQDGQTFLIVARKFNKQYVYRFHASDSLYIFSPRNKIRRFVLFLITHQYFELLILLTILTNCVFLAMSNPPEEAEYVFAAIYTAEMFLKIIGRGFALHKYAYLRNAWNWLDFLVVILGYITMLPGVENLSGIRTFRVLRALRTISAVKGLKAMVNTLLKSIRMLSDVLILTTFFLCVFALIGLQLFVGVMQWKCVKKPPDGWPQGHESFARYIKEDSNHYIFPGDGVAVLCGNSSVAFQCPENYTCLPDTGPNPWSQYISYDHFGWALLTSLQLVTMDYWESIYNSVIATKGPGYIVYFLFVIFLGPFYLINLVLAVVSLSYEQETAAMQDQVLRTQAFAKLKRTGSTYSFDGKMNPEPLYEEDAKKIAERDAYIAAHPEESENPIEPEEPTEVTLDVPANPSYWRKTQTHVAGLVNSSAFETLITLCILFNTLAMALEHFDMDETFLLVLDNCNLVFTSVFIMEMVLKLIAFGVKGYCKNKWNLFDGTIVILSVLDMALTYSETIDGAGLSVLRTFRLLRVLKLAQSWKTMGDLLNTIGSSVGAVGNITVILAIIVYMFAVVGMQLFQKAYENSSAFKDNKIPRWNFSDFGHSFMVIFRILCGKWIEPLWWTMRATNPAAICFILPAFVIGNFVILNLFLALLLNSFSGGGDDEPEDEEAKKKKEEEEKKKKKKKKKKKRLDISGMLGKTANNLSGSRSKVGPDENCDDRDHDAHSRTVSPVDDEEKKEAALNLSNNLKNGEQENGLEMRLFHRLPNGQTQQENYNGYKYNFDETPGKPIGRNTKMHSPPFENRHSLTTAIDLDEAALRIRDQPDSNKRLHCLNRVKSDDRLVASGDSLSNGDVVGNGPAPVIINGNSRISAGSSHKDVSLCDNESRIPPSSPGHESKRDTIVTVESGDTTATATGVRPCCPGFCYCESNYCDSYKESCIRRTWHGMRFYVCSFVEHKYFEWFILAMIVISSLTLVFEDIHLHEKVVLKNVLSVMNYVFAVTFTLEMLLKIFGLGFVGYFSNLWNCLDCFIVAISLASITGNKNLQSFRSLRALRPLRAISRFEGMKIVVNSLVHAVPAIVNVMLVCLIFWLIFSIVGYQLFNGKFFKCINSETLEKYNHTVVPNKTMCNKTAGMRWVNSKINFDSSFSGFLALFQVATLEGVFEVMDDSVDGVGHDQQPIYEYSFYNYFYYVIFIIMGSFFILNLFIGVIIDNFNRLKQQYEDTGALGMFLTPGQRSWVNTIKKTYYRKPRRQFKRPQNKFRAWLFDLILQRKFEVLIMSVILTNMVTMMMEHNNQSENFTSALRYLNYIFTGIFIVEAVIRLIAMRFDYFKLGWNVFDFTIVVFSIVGIIVEDVLQEDMILSPGLLRVVRVFRLGRLLRFFEGAKGVRRLLFTLVKSLPGLVNIAMLLCLIIFIYAIIGMSSFGYVKKTNGITDVVNFETFNSSMLLLFRVATAAGWNTILDPLMVTPPDCNPDLDNGGTNGDCGNRILAVIFFVSYILIIFLIMINMYIAVILENFNEAQSQEEIGVSDDDLETFIQVWEEFDPTATHFIGLHQLSDFLDSLEPPLQIPKPNRHLFGSLQVPIKTGFRIYCLDLMQALVRRAIGGLEGHEEEDLKMLVDRLEERFQHMRKKEETIGSLPEQHSTEIHAALRIQKAIRIFLLRKRLRDCTRSRLRSYQPLKSEKEKGHGWNEKQIVDHTHAQQGLESVVAMLWYQQTKRYDDQRADATLDEGKKNGDDGETAMDESAMDGNSDTLVLTDPSQPKYSPNTLSVDY